MASIKRSGKRWRAQLYRGGVRESKVFDTKLEAQEWANSREPLLSGAKQPDRLLSDAIAEYKAVKAPKLGGADWAKKKLKNLADSTLAPIPLATLSRGDFATWRDARLAKVSPATVNRELNLLHSVLTHAVDLGWLTAHPMKGLKRPENPPSRKRRVSQDEIDAVVKALGYESGPPANLSQRVALAFLFALETAMRGGEIVRLQWAHVGPKSVHLPKTKNGDARNVPLSSRAREIIGELERVRTNELGDAEWVFGLSDAQRDSMFRKGRDKAGIKSLHFHDSRSEAIWRLSKKLDVLELARVIGHRNLSSLMLYYNASADELADKLG